VTGAASLAYNAQKKADAQRAAIPRWHGLGPADIVVTSQRLVFTRGAQSDSFWYAETGPLQLGPGPGGVPSVQFQPTGAPPLRLDFAWAPVMFVFVHHLVDGRPPGVPLPPGVLERAQAQGRIR
jgi:hypothetical protein